MRWELIDSNTPTYVVVLDPDDEAFGQLSDFARDRQLTAAQVTAIGGFERATVAWFDRQRKEYRPIQVDEHCEVLSLLGDIALADDGPQLHAHVVLGKSDGTTCGGHFLEGHVFPTMEVIVRETPAELRKTYRPEIGIAVIDLNR